MTNLFKIFLIFNLFSSVPANNFSVPLPETELKMGQNVSELTKRDKSISVYGGMKFLGFTFVKKGSTCEEPCTFSFPVSNGNEKGFLTSNLCASTTALSTDGDLIGSVKSRKFDAKRGLDYAFVVIKDKYWSDEISSKVAYYRCATTTSGRIYETEEPLLILPTPNEPLSVGDEVYIHGGNIDTVHGKILETDVKIGLGVPGTCGKNWVNNFKAIKMEMNKEFESSFIGAPVFLVVQVPGSNQMIASPVGQVVRGIGPSSTRPGYDPNKIWYYIPLEPILKDSGLTLVVGDFSSLPPQSNNTNFNDVLFTDNLTTESNASEIVPNHLDKRWVAPLYTYPGLRVWTSNSHSHIASTSKPCTLGFPVRKARGRNQFEHGFLILGSCMSTDIDGRTNGVFYYRPPEEIKIGSAGRLVYSRTGLNYAIIILVNHSPYVLWNDLTSIDIQVPGRFATVIARAFAPGAGTEVCFKGGYSDHICGVVTDPAARLTSINPWDWEAAVRQGHLGLGRTESWFNLIKVRLNEIPRALTDGVKSYDFGSPVYYVRERNDEGQATKVQPVGIVMDYVEESEEIDDMCITLSYMYCVSVYNILLNNPDLDLIGIPR